MVIFSVTAKSAPPPTANEKALLLGDFDAQRPEILPQVLA